MKNRKWIRWLGALLMVIALTVTFTAALAEQEEVTVTPGAEAVVQTVPECFVANAPEEEEATEEETGMKNGVEGLHLVKNVTDDHAEFMFNTGIHKNNEENGRDVDINLLHLTAEAYANVGAFTGVNAKGEKIEGVGVNVGCKADFATAEMIGKVRIGNLENNVLGGTEIDIGTAGAAAQVTAGVINGNVVVNLNATLEANVLEAKLEGGGTIDGVQVKGHVGGKVGVGVKARMGMENGKFKAEIGVAMGIGIEFGVEVDLGAAYDKVKEHATDIAKTTVNTVCKAANKILGWFR